MFNEVSISTQARLSSSRRCSASKPRTPLNLNDTLPKSSRFTSILCETVLFLCSSKKYDSWFRAHDLPHSERQYPLLGVNLLFLLAHNRIADFHTEMELVPVDQHSNMYIKYSVLLEQYLMEGSYTKVVNAKSSIPAEYYTYFTDLLFDTVRCDGFFRQPLSNVDEHAFPGRRSGTAANRPTSPFPSKSLRSCLWHRMLLR